MIDREGTYESDERSSKRPHWLFGITAEGSIISEGSYLHSRIGENE